MASNKTINLFSAGTPEQAMNFLMQTAGNVTGKMNFETALGVKHIYTMADFPSAIGGIITLTTGVYQIHGALSTSDRFRIASGATVNIRGLDAFGDSLTYTGVGNMFDTNGLDITSFFLLEITISTPNGTVLDFIGTGAKTSFFFTINTTFFDCLDVGLVQNFDTYASTFSAMLDVGNGITLDTVNFVSSDQAQFKNGKDTSGTFFTLQGTIQSYSQTDAFFAPTATESCFDIDSGITIIAGNISGNTFDNSLGGAFFKTGSLDQTSKSWTVKSNANVPDSAANAELFISSPSATVIGDTDTVVPIDGTWTDGAERFTTNADGIMTYVGLEDISILFMGSFSVTAGSTNQDIVFYFAKGNATDNAITAFADAGGGQVTVTNTAHGLSNGDRVFIKGTTSYNGDFIIANVTANTFEITDTFVADDATGEWQLILQKSKQLNTIASTTKASSTSVQTRVAICTGDTVQAFLESTSHTTSPTAQTANISTAI